MSHPDIEESSVVNFKRRIAALQEENRALQEGASKRQSCVPPTSVHFRVLISLTIAFTIARQINKYITSGCAIRRLVSLAGRVEDLVAEADRRGCEDGLQQEPTDEQVFIIDASFVLMVF